MKLKGFMIKLLPLCVALFFVGSVFTTVKADEGMWVPLLLKKNESDMQSKGFKLTTEDIYSINNSSLKDAIVIFGRGCTGDVVSNKGLVFTNHHCGYGQIQSHSTLENNYLTDGFWADSFKEELACPGLNVTFLVRMEDVTDQMVEGLDANISEKVRADSIAARSKRIEEAAVEGTHYKARVAPFYYGNQYYLHVNEVFDDVRLVGAPPSNIGKFGGDTDNWMWPRHTGDFAVFRIYADKDNKPAEYSEKNVPYTPKKHLKIDLGGVEEGDFTFVFGYPGRTQEYLPSYAVKLLVETENPMRIAARTKRLNIINSAMNASKLNRIRYSAKSAGIANAWKKWQGESKGIERLHTVETKENFEKEFSQWASTQAPEYTGVLPALKSAYNDLGAFTAMQIIFTEHIIASDVIRFTTKFRRLVKLHNEGADEKEINTLVEKLKKDAVLFFKDYDPKVDRRIFEEMVFVDDKDGSTQIIDFVDKDFDKQLDVFYAKSIFSDEERCMEFLENYKASDYKKIEKDMLYKYVVLVYGQYQNQTYPAIRIYRNKIDSLQRIYMRGQMQMREDFNFYPDANFTLRVTYGNVKGFKPADATYYKHYTTLKGIMEKENPDIYDYVVEDRLKELYLNKDYGRYANKQGEMPVAFIGTNHTTGGNSGSPVLNAEGNLIGINFDRNWQGTMSDIVYDPEMCRNIAIDIRYCLFIIDKFAGAQWLIDEMDILE